MAGDAVDFRDEIDALILRPAEEGLAPAPYSRRASAERTTTTLPDGYRRYTAGPFSVEVSPLGLIMVRQSDWLSKFAQAMYGGSDVTGLFARVHGNDVVPIEDDDLIETGEVLVHLPTLRAQRTRKALTDFVAREELREESRSGDIALNSYDRLMNGPANRAWSEDRPLDAIVDANIGLTKGVGVFTIQRILDVWLLLDPDLETLDENAKQQAFLTEEARTGRILYYEFLKGDGLPERVFDERHAITRAIREGNVGLTIARDLGRRRAAAARAATMPDDPFIAPAGLLSFAGNYDFSPDQTTSDTDGLPGTLAGLAESAGKHIAAAGAFLKGRPGQFFIGGCTYEVDTTDRRVGPAGIEYAAVVTNYTTISSLMAHGPDVLNVPRDSATEAAIRKEALTTLPYSTVKQEFRFYVTPAPPLVP